jgi:hypothetical protein
LTEEKVVLLSKKAQVSPVSLLERTPPNADAAIRTAPSEEAATLNP